MPSYLCTLQSGALILVLADDKPQLFKALSKFDDPTQCGIRELVGSLAVEVEPMLKGHLRHSSKRFKGSAGADPSSLTSNLWRDRQFTDCCLSSKDGSTEPMHRCILKAACPHLAQQLQLHGSTAGVLETAAPSREVLSALIRYMYTHDIGELEVEESWQLLELACEYQLPHLVQSCEAAIAEFYEAFCLDRSHAHWAVPLASELPAAIEAADHTLMQAVRARRLGREHLEDFFLWNAARYGWKVLTTCASLKGLPTDQLEYLRRVVATAYPPVIRRWTLGVAQTVCSDEYDRAGGELTEEEATAVTEWRQLCPPAPESTNSPAPEPFCLDEESLEATLTGSQGLPTLQLGRVRLCGNGGEEVLAAAVFPALSKILPRSRQLIRQASSTGELKACESCQACAGITASGPCSTPTQSKPTCSLCCTLMDVRSAIASDLALSHQASLDTKATEAEAMARAEQGDLRSEVMLRACIMAPMYGLTQQRTTPDKDSNESEVSGFSDDSEEEDDDDMLVDMDSDEWLQGFVIGGARAAEGDDRADMSKVATEDAAMKHREAHTLDAGLVW